MNVPTTEQPERQLQQTLGQWQDRQRVHGNVFQFLCLASFISLALFWLNPCPGTTWLLPGSLMLMVSAGVSMLCAAHAVAQHKLLLQCPAVAIHSPDPVKPWIVPTRNDLN